ncbi:hypothetical protein JTB14_027767 [Gonioctena quinquepunctata]|nr:hypothetical protein JTB14_027767 [Gonioctena quinquepunctata]
MCENSQDEIKICKHCRKSVKFSIECEFCETDYHPSCARQAKVVCQRDNKESESDPKIDERKIKSIFKKLITEFLNPFQKNIEKEFSELKKSTQHISNSVAEQKTNLDKAVCELQQLRVENGKLNKKIEEIEVKIAALETQSTENERIRIVNQAEATNSSLFQTEEAISEWEERKKHSKNIITNISESTKKR